MRQALSWLTILVLAFSLANMVSCSEQEQSSTQTTGDTTSHEGDEHAGDDHADHDHADHGHTEATPGEAAADEDPAPVASSEREDGPLRVVVSIPTLLWPLETLLGEDDELETILAPGQSAHGFELTPEQVRLIDHADLLVLVGLGLDGEIARAAENRPSTHREVIVLAEIAEAAGQLPANIEAHGHDHDHAHAHADPHIWLLPDLMSVYSMELWKVLERAYSRIGLWEGEASHRVGQEAGNASDSAAIAGMSLTTRLEPFAGEGVVINHSAFSLFLDFYGLTEHAVLQPNPNVEPTPGDIQKTVDAIREHDLKAILVVPWHDRSAAERVSEITGVPIIEVDPVGDGNWPKLMDDWYISLYTALSGAPPVQE